METPRETILGQQEEIIETVYPIHHSYELYEDEWEAKILYEALEDEENKAKAMGIEVDELRSLDTEEDIDDLPF